MGPEAERLSRSRLASTSALREKQKSCVYTNAAQVSRRKPG